MVKLYAFGDPHLVGREPAALKRLERQTKRLALLIYLLCDDRDRAHRRDEILALFWPESDSSSGRNCLRQSLFGLRSLLGSDILTGNGSDDLYIDTEKIQSDVAVFRRRIRDGLPDAALTLHRAPFLSGFHLHGCPEFAGWVERTRNDLHSTAVGAAMNLAHISEGCRDLEASLHWWRVAQGHAPFDERILRRIMALLAGSGNRAKALAEFREFEARIERELGMPPSQATAQLGHEISSGTFDPSNQWVGDRRSGAEPTAEAAPSLVPAQHVKRQADGPEF